jgi:hypothetical protein
MFELSVEWFCCGSSWLREFLISFGGWGGTGIIRWAERRVGGTNRIVNSFLLSRIVMYVDHEFFIDAARVDHMRSPSIFLFYRHLSFLVIGA